VTNSIVSPECRRPRVVMRCNVLKYPVVMCCGRRGFPMEMPPLWRRSSSAWGNSDPRAQPSRLPAHLFHNPHVLHSAAGRYQKDTRPWDPTRLRNEERTWPRRQPRPSYAPVQVEGSYPNGRRIRHSQRNAGFDYCRERARYRIISLRMPLNRAV
jgi:hypothetical protein